MFGNQRDAALHVHKWHDLNADGQRQADEPLLDGWEIIVRDPATGIVVDRCVTHPIDLVGGGDVTVEFVAPRWQNPVNMHDVNGDTFITPNDVLQIVNELNNHRISDAEGRLPDSSSTTPQPPPYVDVNGDDFVTSNDVLRVVNTINNQQAGGEGEGESVLAAGFSWLPPIGGGRQAASVAVYRASQGAADVLLDGSHDSAFPVSPASAALRTAGRTGFALRADAAPEQPADLFDEPWDLPDLDGVLDELAADAGRRPLL